MARISSRLLSLLIASSALLCVLLTIPVALRGTHPNPVAERAVTTLVHAGGASAAAAVPAGFATVAGYSPVVDHGMLSDPNGSCSSPVPLPHEFDLACREHDYGYDLLRYGEHVGGVLPASARPAVDAQLGRKMLLSCSDRPGVLDRGTCVTWAGVASFFVAINTIRQGYSVPDREGLRSLLAGGAGIAALLGFGVLLRRGWRRLTPPSVPVTLAVALGTTFALFPSFVPRGAIVQGAALAAYILIVRGIARRVLRGGRWSSLRARRIALAGSGIAMAVVLFWSVGMIDMQRLAIGMPTTDLGYWSLVAVVAGAVVALPTLVRAVWRHRARAWKPVVAALATGAMLSPMAPVQAADFGAKNDRPLLAASPVGAVRVFVDDHTGSTLRERAEIAVQRLEAAGGFAKSRIVIAIPTGSGWVDPAAVRGLETRFHGDVATVAIQYASTPSWFALVFHRGEANRSAEDLYAAIERELATMPVNKRPFVHVYGESLGALAGQQVLRTPAGRAGICSALWVGPPGGARVGLGKEGIVANASDPVVHTRPALLIRPNGERPWLPVISYLNGAVDLLGSLSVPAGSGHRYGADQANALPICTRT